MIYSPHLNLAIYTPPKCASTMLHHVLCEQANWIYVMGPQFDECHIEKHTHCVPFMMRNRPDPVTVLMWRDPYERALSLYGHYLQWWGVRATFREFLTDVVRPGVYEFLSATVWEFEQKVELPVTWYVKVGDWDKLRSLGVPLPADLPLVNTSEKLGAEYGAWESNFVSHWMERDFGYAAISR